MRISGSYHYVCEKTTVPLKKWVHGASTHDGKEVGSKASPGKVDFKTANTYVGAEYGDAVPDDGHDQYVGEIDEAYLANRAFSEKKIQELMVSTLSVEVTSSCQ